MRENKLVKFKPSDQLIIQEVHTLSDDVWKRKIFLGK